ncbi:MAG: diacylglycerol kinase family lipid kinase [Acidobacteria bacterium]|nr:diacylglycerol kinase family lipid kinase [Acidobacteriota bacterium]MBI3278286.1 diacylglycerol kinase family lipid kinase [Acidobacteriota bacterium]
MKTAAIVNPRSASGKTGKRWPRIAQQLEKRLGPVDTRFTERPAHAIDLARELIDGGYDLIIAAGGDGTVNEVANGFMRDGRPVQAKAALGVLPLGTGGDFQRTIGVPSDAGKAIEILARGRRMEVDLGRAMFQGCNGARRERAFINLVSFGMGGDVAARARNFLSPVSGSAAFLWATLASFVSYQGKHVELELDGQPVPMRSSILNIAIGNGRFHGGGMHICPLAKLDDGLLEVTVADSLGWLTLIKDLPVLYSDNVYSHPKTRHFRARRVVARSAETVRIEVDGEPLGALPLEIEIVPRACQVMVP